MTPESTGQQDVRSFLRILWRWKLLLLAFLVVIPVGAYLLERGKPKIYQSSTLVELTGSVGGGNVPAVPGNLLAVNRLITTTPVARAAADHLHPPANPGSLLGEVSSSADVNTGFLTITAQDHDPRRAAAIANAFAAALGSEQTAQVIHSIDLQIGALDKQLAAVSSTDGVARATLLQNIAQLRAQRDSSVGGVQVIQRAVASATPVGPNPRRAVEIALVIALLLGIGAVVLAEKGDLRLRTPEALEHLTNMPLLGVIPPSAFSPDALDAPRDDEAFQMLSASLTYFNVDRRLASVAIISPGPGEGKTTVAVGLAVATARAGKHAILIDADLRRPQVSARLGLPETPGLGALLARERTLSEVLIEPELDLPEGGRLLVLPAGTPPPNPVALLRSEGMQTLLRELEGEADLVIVDTAAALAVGDALPLFRTVSGVAMIVRMNRSSRAAVRRLHKVIASAGGTVMGVVATGTVSAAGGYGRGYDVYARAQDGRASRSLLGRRRQRATERRSAATSRPQAATPRTARTESPRQRAAGAETNAPARTGPRRDSEILAAQRPRFFRDAPAPIDTEVASAESAADPPWYRATVDFETGDLSEPQAGSSDSIADAAEKARRQG
jgi:capsular exopolysaccharide synthesis family protein